MEAAIMPGNPGTHTIERFTFENGAELRDLRVGYVTHGSLNAASDNAVLLVPGTSNNLHWPDQMLGPGKPFDTDKYFFISTDAIGGGTSTQPGDGLGTQFPRYTIRDMVRAEHALVTDGLGLDQLHAVAGPSMGSFQGVEWGIHYPDFMRGLVLIVPAARSDALFGSIVETLTAMITSHADYQAGAYTENPTAAIRNGGLVYFPWLFSDDYMRTLTTKAAHRSAMTAIGANWAENWDANSILWRYNASRHHDAAIPFGGDMAAALAQITAKCLLLVATTDRTIPGYLSRELHDGLAHAEWVDIPTILGHHGGARPAPGTPEHAIMQSHIPTFLDGLSETA